jgi:hypothetical protein
MKANTREEQGSTRSCPSAFTRFRNALSTRPSALEKSVQNPYKSDHFRKVQFSSVSAPATYNFTALKCTDFRIHPNRRRPNPTRVCPNPAAESHDVRLKGPVDCCSLSLGERARVRDRLVPSLRLCRLGDLYSMTFTISFPAHVAAASRLHFLDLPALRLKIVKIGEFVDFRAWSTTPYQGLTPTQNRRTPISIRTSSSFVIGGVVGRTKWEIMRQIPKRQNLARCVPSTYDNTTTDRLVFLSLAPSTLDIGVHWC